MWWSPSLTYIKGILSHWVIWWRFISTQRFKRQILSSSTLVPETGIRLSTHDGPIRLTQVKHHEFGPRKKQAIKQAIKGYGFLSHYKRLWYLDFICYVIVSHQEHKRIHLQYSLTFMSQVRGICVSVLWWLTVIRNRGLLTIYNMLCGMKWWYRLNNVDLNNVVFTSQ